ncbi:Ig-like domain-containing protein [Pseudopedobacter beijingensis]|uniref:Ig-like domain-containing protein n=1 Tax=Pseudopedobacter beijingensis TaxID=1207056 RepID=A0ABW4I7N8_9SPHI
MKSHINIISRCRIMLVMALALNINIGKAQRVVLDPEPVFIPNGFVETKDLVYFKLDEQGSEGTVEKVITDYNKYIVGTVAGFTEEAQTKDDLKDKNGSPLDWNLRMDIIHPETPSVPRPVCVIIATQPIRNIPTYTPFQQIFAKRGYITVVIDHANSPLVKPFGYHDSYYDLDGITGVKVYTAAIRYLRANAAKYSIDPDRIGGMGHSKAAYGITRLSDPSINYDSKERGAFRDSYNPQLNTEYPSHIQVGYQSMGNGTRWSKDYVTDNYAPTITAVGYYDQYNQWLDWPNVVKAYSKDHDASWLGIPMMDKGHDMAAGFQPDLGYVREEVVEKFFSNYLEPQLAPNVLYVAPYNGQSNENIVGYKQPVIAHFSPQMDVLTVQNAMKVIDVDTNTPIPGNWKASRKDTYFEFVPSSSAFQKGKSYKVTISTDAKSINGISLSQSYEHTFTVNIANEEGYWNGVETDWSYGFSGTQQLPAAVNGVTMTAKELYTATTGTAKPSNAAFSSTSDGINNIGGWFPTPPSAKAFVRIGSSMATRYELEPIDENTNKLKISLSGYYSATNTGSTGSTANKFSFYDIGSASPIAKYAMRLNFSLAGDDPQRGYLRMVLGNNGAGTNFFNNTSNTSLTTDSRYFTAFNWTYAQNSDDLAFAYRNKTSASDAVWTTISPNTFKKDGGDYDIEIYANNSSSEQYYTKGNEQFRVPSRAFHIWVDGLRLGEDFYPNTSDTEDLAVNQPINAVGFNHIFFNNPTLSAQLTISNFNASYAQSTTLPVKLTSFNGKLQGDHVELNWLTASEKNNSHFDVLRSADGKTFDKIGFVQGKGTSDLTNNYSYTDLFPYKGNNYYKLKQVDFNGNAEESQAILVKALLSDLLEIKIHQKGEKTIVGVYSAVKSMGVLTITDVLGRVLKNEKISLIPGHNQFVLDLGATSQGIYIVNLVSEEGKLSAKFIK